MDTMTITVLDDGTLKIETDRISQANHITAEAFLRNADRVCGGKQTRTHKQGILGTVKHSLEHRFGLGHSH